MSKFNVKALQTRREKLKAELESRREELRLVNERYNLAARQLKAAEIALAEASRNAEVRVSEHALLRYCERVLGVDMAKVEQQILSPAVLDMVKTLGGTGKYPNGSFRVIMENNVVTTITT